MQVNTDRLKELLKGRDYSKAALLLLPNKIKLLLTGKVQDIFLEQVCVVKHTCEGQITKPSKSSP